MQETLETRPPSLGSARFPEVENGNPVQYSSLENPMDRNLAYYTVHGVAKIWTRLKWFSKYSVIASEQLVESMDSGKMLGRVSEESGTFGHFNFLFLEICQALFYGCYTLNTSVFYVFLTCSITIGFLDCWLPCGCPMRRANHGMAHSEIGVSVCQLLTEQSWKPREDYWKRQS